MELGYDPKLHPGIEEYLAGTNANMNELLVNVLLGEGTAKQIKTLWDKVKNAANVLKRKGKENARPEEKRALSEALFRGLRHLMVCQWSVAAIDPNLGYEPRPLSGVGILGGDGPIHPRDIGEVAKWLSSFDPDITQIETKRIQNNLGMHDVFQPDTVLTESVTDFLKDYDHSCDKEGEEDEEVCEGQSDTQPESMELV